MSQPLISELISNYPKSQWKRVIVAVLIYGINSLKRHHHFSHLSIDQLEMICGVKKKKATDMSLFMRELNNIKKELLKLDKKIDLTANKENINKNSSTQNSNKRSTSHPIKGEETVKCVTNAPSTRYKRDKNKTVTSMARGGYIQQWPKSTRAIDYEKVRVRNMIPSLREARRQVNKTINRTTYTKPKITFNPPYLKNVKSKIISNIDKDKREYKLRKNTMKRVSNQVERLNTADKYLQDPIIDHFTKMAYKRDLSPQKDLEGIRSSELSEHYSYAENSKGENWRAKGKPKYDNPSEYEREYIYS